MKKFYKIVLLLLVFIFLTTYNPIEFYSTLEKKNNFFKIQKIIIQDNFLIKKNDIYEQLNHIYKKNILLIKRKDIEESLKEINFLKKIEVKKKYPNTIIIKIFETKPVAILFKNKNKYLLDNLSNVIPFEKSMNFAKLPSVFGDGAENNFTYFLNELKINNFPIKKIENFYYFQIGRWDLHLENNKIIKYPFSLSENIIKKSIQLLDREDFKNYNIIDLRINGKIIVE